MTPETREKWEAAIAEIARAFGQFVETVRRAWEAACQTWHKLTVALSAAVVKSEHPQADLPRLVRHFRACHDPLTRAQYLLAEARRGQMVPMLM